MKRIYFETVKKWAIRLGIPTGVVGTGIGLIFLFLSLSGAITITGFSGDQVCAGTIEDPCYAYINLTAEEDIFIYPLEYDPWGRETPFEFSPAVKSWKLQRSWGSGWRDIPLDKTCTGTWCGAPNNKGVKYSWVMREDRDYQVRIVAYKNQIDENIKWAVNYEDKEYLDPEWIGIDIKEESKGEYKISDSSDIKITTLETIFCTWKPDSIDDGWKSCEAVFSIENFNENKIKIKNRKDMFKLDFREENYKNLELTFSEEYELKTYEIEDSVQSVKDTFLSKFEEKEIIEIKEFSNFKTIPKEIDTSKSFAIKVNFEIPKYSSNQFNFTIEGLSAKIDPDVSACGTLNVSGHYTLDNDVFIDDYLSVNKAYCFRIESSDVVLDGQGNTILYNGTAVHVFSVGNCFNNLIPIKLSGNLYQNISISNINYVINLSAIDHTTCAKNTIDLSLFNLEGMNNGSITDSNITIISNSNLNTTYGFMFILGDDQYSLDNLFNNLDISVDYLNTDYAARIFWIGNDGGRNNISNMTLDVSYEDSNEFNCFWFEGLDNRVVNNLINLTGNEYSYIPSSCSGTITDCTDQGMTDLCDAYFGGDYAACCPELGCSAEVAGCSGTINVGCADVECLPGFSECSYGHSNNYWNTTSKTGTRIYSNGTNIGGNFWDNSTGGPSTLCVDSNTDGFCDSFYDVVNGNFTSTCTTNNCDYLAYSNKYSAVTDTCTYTSGDWNVDCNDNCSISAAVHLGGNDLIFSGLGSFWVRDNIAGIGNLNLSDGCNIILEGSDLIYE